MMGGNPADGGAPRTVLLLPVTYLLHLAEEWFGGFPAWTAVALGAEVSSERFLLINAIGFPLFCLAAVTSVRNRRMAWIGASMAALFGLNGIVHALATLALGTYSPGTITGLLVFLPLSVLVIRSFSARLPRPVLARAIVAGILAHGLVTFIALQ